MSTACFELRGVGQMRGGRTVLHDVSIEIPRQLITVLCGPSGGGKTSLLRLLNRLDDPVEGEILHEGRPIVEYPVTELRQRVALVFQTPVMFAGTVLDNLAVAAELAGISDSELNQRSKEVMMLAELEPALLERPGGELSVGQKQRVNLARALMTAPEVLLLDEPTSALDPDTSRSLMKTIQRLSEERSLTIIVATHRVIDARDYAQHAINLREGRIIDSGDAQRLLRELPDADAAAQ